MANTAMTPTRARLLRARLPSNEKLLRARAAVERKAAARSAAAALALSSSFTVIASAPARELDRLRLVPGTIRSRSKQQTGVNKLGEAERRLRLRSDEPPLARCE